jgi:hypothetical protein
MQVTDVVPQIVQDEQGNKFVQILIPFDKTQSSEITSKSFPKNGKTVPAMARLCYTRAIFGDSRICTVDGETISLRFKEGYCPDLEKNLPPRFEVVGPSWEIKETKPATKNAPKPKAERKLTAV